MKWTHELPTESGWYFMQAKSLEGNWLSFECVYYDASEKIIWEVDDYNGYVGDYKGNRWQGPIFPEPEKE